ncbi:hypothetical protein PAAG_11499 [Paracoccidioides lutzii Pb01]|uniref:Uncharacterized protein n=1 Tax=Paracoccidioides lutzii (strain ATCC MYA-826 / Pb01) TaxID=502779 RepID=A0A0A2V1X2_PARBA|nr:hypothetical protein PAAG_11499 [Paracoccidioides lutzii Pb01]KGQ01776.1 hypothetical protein PAAG_11499 [Paracoccidioides lutzii Pb01]
MFYDHLAAYQGFGGIVPAKDEGENIARALGLKKNEFAPQQFQKKRRIGYVHICRLITVGSSIVEAAALFIALERSCQAQLLVEHAHCPYTGTPEEVCWGWRSCVYQENVRMPSSDVHAIGPRI